ncbi:MAG: hypothetical protein PVH87_05055 [Desulfobacteraceae bacterium]|jgi:hypothetical protein
MFKKHIKNQCKRDTGQLAFNPIIILVLFLTIGFATPMVWAEKHRGPTAWAKKTWGPAVWAEENGDEDEIPFDEAKIFFELNDTDGDLGIHALIDGEPWKRLEIVDPNEMRMLNIRLRGRLKRQGLTEVFFESAEPSFDELEPKDFFRRFPEGEYEIEGITLEGEELEGEVWLSHVLPAPPEGIEINGIAAAEDCDADILPTVSGPITISWDPVTESHPDLGKEGEVEIEQYQLVVEQVGDGDDFTLSFELSVNDENRENRWEVEIPADLIPVGDTKFEILVRDENQNQTAVESCFIVE